jgi:transcriptional regulator with XRE-family HTH domain
MKNPKIDTAFMQSYDQGMLRAEFTSLFWVAISLRREREKFTLESLAKLLRKNKGEVSRWFSSRRANWTIDTIARIADALDVDIRISAIDRKTGVEFTAAGPVSSVKSSNVIQMPTRKLADNPTPAIHSSAM